jgi:hypothetical protein
VDVYAKDLVSQMYWNVREESPLWTLPDEITDYLGRGRTVVHGPFAPADCSRVLLRWFDAGWLDLIAYANHDLWPPGTAAEWETSAVRQGQFLLLAHQDARTLLAAPKEWADPARGGEVMLCISDEGEEHPQPEWLAAR